MIAALVLAAAVFAAPVQVADQEGPWAAAPVPGWLERETSGEMGRVRLVDGRGREVPYRLLDAASDLASPWSEAVPRNLRTTGDGFAFELDTGAGAPVDAVEIGLDGEAGVLAVTVSGGEPHGVLTSGVRVGRVQGVTVERVDLPVTDAGRLELRLTTLVSGVEPARVRLRRTLRPPDDGDAGVAYRAVRLPSANARDRWRLVATGDGARVDALTLDVRSPEVLRRRVAVRDPRAGNGAILGRGEIVRLPLADGGRGIASLRLPLVPGAWRVIEVEVERGDEAPIELTGARGEVARRWLLFPRGAGAGKLRLVSGDDRRSDSLERGPLPVLPGDAVRAAVGPPSDVTAPTPAPPPAAPSSAVSLLFLVAAVLLGLLAWRALGRSR